MHNDSSNKHLIRYNKNQKSRLPASGSGFIFWMKSKRILHSSFFTLHFY